jgi:hypothetical protein
MARGAVEAKKADRRARRRALDPLVLGLLANFCLVLCEACGLEQAARRCDCDDHWECVCEPGCLLCSHLYATISPRHDQAVASLRVEV